MRLPAPLFVCLLLIVPFLRAADSSGEPNQKEPAKLAPLVVNEAPFGYLGIKHATAKFDVFRLVTFRGSLAYLQVDELNPDSPGLAAGIRQGDRIVAVNGKATREWSFSKLKYFGETLEAGQHVPVELYRPSDGSTVQVEVVVSKRPKTKPVSAGPKPTRAAGFCG